MITKKQVMKMGPKEDFLSFWVDRCEHKGTKKQLKILYDEDFNWASWLLSNALDRDARKDYAIYSASAVLTIFQVQYPLDTRVNDAIQASTNDTINQSVLDDAFDAYVMAATADFNANYTYAANSAYIASYGSFARLINGDTSNFKNIANLAAISAVNADATKKQEIFDYGVGLL